ncbi:unnamed protein product [Phaedon cochleariae]|uniref:RecA family profile 1 domain-containing protein n=1 Tax=Phaedon cochleariae TaxID=80249 RepID=A0A9P0DF21_PHACE|nr:unnamed protein product [Phaedon cochleariae]
MLLLSEGLHSSLDNSILKLLSNKNISTVLDFLHSDSKVIEKATPLIFREILNIKKELLKIYSIKPENAYHYYQFILLNCAIIQTGIESLDNLLEGGLFTGNIYEICGLPATGKTLFCLTLLKNVATSLESVYYLDTKYDFQALKLKQMYSHLSKVKLVESMNHIMVKRTNTKQDLLNSLLEIKKIISSGRNIKLLIIDSLPALCFQSNDHNEQNSFLNEMVNNLHYLAVKCNIVIIVTNLITLWNEGDFTNKDVMKERVACGSYWYNIPNSRLKFHKEGNKSTITLMKSIKIMPKVPHCEAKITDEGFI